MRTIISLFKFSSKALRPADIVIPPQAIYEHRMNFKEPLKKTQNLVPPDSQQVQGKGLQPHQAELRFSLADAKWLSEETKERLKVNYSNFLNNHGEVTLRCAEFNNYDRNLQKAYKHLRYILWDCSKPLKRKENVATIGFEIKNNERLKSKRIISEHKKLRRLQTDETKEEKKNEKILEDESSV